MDGVTLKNTHKSSVTAILGNHNRPVYSHGSNFYNKDRWTGRALLVAICKDLQRHPGGSLDYARASKWVREANELKVYDPSITIADTPDKVNDRLACALIGGAYHEAWHTKFSCRRDLSVEEILDLLKPRWSKVQNWQNAAKLLLDWSNIIEDIRIERLGGKAYPGTHTKMCDLQDFILDLEAKGNADARAHGMAVNGALSVIGKTFRDLGLGYNTKAQQAALESYKRDNPQAVQFTTTGAVGDSLHEAINMSAKDDLGCLRVAFDVLIAIADASVAPPPPQPQPQPQQKQDKQNQDKQPQQPQQGDPDESDSEEGEGEGESEDKSESKSKPSKSKSKSEDEGDESEADEGDTDSDSDDDSDSESNGSDSDSDDGDSEEDDDDDDSEGDGEGNGDDDGGEDQEEDEDLGNSGKGKGSDKEEADSEDAEGDSDSDGKEDAEAEKEAEADSESNGSEGDSGSDNEDSEAAEAADSDGADGAGGQVENEGKDLSEMLKEALANGDSMGLKDNNTALQEAFDQAEANKIKQEGGVKRDEAVFKPADKSLDRLVAIGPERAAAHRAEADAILNSVKDEVSYLRARLRSVFRAAEMTATVHGTKHGRILSDRMLVDSRVALMGGAMPNRAYLQRDEQADMSLSCAILLDQSPSMEDKLITATQAMMAIAEPMDAIGAKVMALGFRNGQRYTGSCEDLKGCHDLNGVDLDVFKTFDERFASVKARFACTRAAGKSTPMANGVQYCLNALNERKEGHRVLFIVTDGAPDSQHGPVVKRQIRIAQEAGIHVIGVGIGRGATYVKTLFPDHVYSVGLTGLAQKLVVKINGIVDHAARKRGQRMKAG